MRRARLKITPNLNNLNRSKGNIPPVVPSESVDVDDAETLPPLEDCSPPPLTVRPPRPLSFEKENASHSPSPPSPSSSTAAVIASGGETPKKTGSSQHVYPKGRPAPNLNISRKRTLSSSSNGSSSRTRTLSGASSVLEIPHELPVFDQRKAEHKRRFNKGVPERSKMTVFDFIFHNPTEGSRMNNSEMESSRELEEAEDGVEETPEEDSIRGSLSDKEDPPEKEEEHEEGAMPVPQVKIGPNGQIVLDEDSTFIETTAIKKAKEDIRKTSLVYDNRATNYGTWAKKRRNVDWSEKETLRFYKALNIFGTDFSMMASIFKKRNRHELKMKFKKEEKCNRNLVDRCLSQGGQFDLSMMDSESEEEPEGAKKKKGHSRKRSMDKQSTEPKKKRRTSKTLRRSRGYYSSSPSSDEEQSQLDIPDGGDPKEVDTPVPIDKDSTFPPGLLAANPGLANATSGSLVVVAASPTPANANLHVYMVANDKNDGSKRNGRVRTLSSSSGALEPPSPK